MKGKLLTERMKRISLFKTRRKYIHVGSAPASLRLTVLNKAILFIHFRNNRVEMRISSQKYEVGELDD